MDGQELTDDQKKEQKRKDRELLAMREAEDLRFIMGDPRGRRFVDKLITRAGIYRLSYESGKTNETMFNEGGRNQGLRLLTDVLKDTPGSYIKMMEEKRDE